LIDVICFPDLSNRAFSVRLSGNFSIRPMLFVSAAIDGGRRTIFDCDPGTSLFLIRMKFSALNFEVALGDDVRPSAEGLGEVAILWPIASDGLKIHSPEILS
jgi:hypothetical protein